MQERPDDSTAALRAAARERLTYGLAAYAFAGWSAAVMVVFSWIVLGTVAGDAPVIGPAIMVTVFFGGAAALLLRHFYQTRAFRRACVTAGAPCWGRVSAHGRAFNPFSSSRKHTVTVALVGTTPVWTVLSSTDETLQRSAPIGASLPGWLHPDGRRAFYPLEIGLLTG